MESSNRAAVAFAERMLKEEEKNLLIARVESLESRVSELEQQNCFRFTNNLRYIASIRVILSLKEVEWKGKSFISYELLLVGTDEVFTAFVGQQLLLSEGMRIVFTYNDGKMTGVKRFDDVS